MADIELRNCPICGTEPIVANYPDVFWVECPNAECHIHGPLRLSRNAADLAWNEMCEHLRIGKVLFDSAPKGTIFDDDEEELMWERDGSNDWKLTVRFFP